MAIQSVAWGGVLKIVSITTITCALLIAIVNAAVTRHVRSQEATLTSPSAILNELSGPSDEEKWREFPLPADLLSALNEADDFQIGHRLAAIPDSVKRSFARAADLDAFLMAEPGGRWEAGDPILDARLPRRRLVAVATLRSFCLVFYERGGLATTNNLAIFRLNPNGAEAVGHTSQINNPSVFDPASFVSAVRNRKITSLDHFF